MNVIILSGGDPISDTTPHCLIEVNGKLVIEHIFEGIATLKSARIVVVLRAKDVRRYHLRDMFRVIGGEKCTLIEIENETQGAACSALLCVDAINVSEDLLILNTNELLNVDFGIVVDRFRSENYDAGSVVFDSVNPQYSFVRLENGFVVEAAEKRTISRWATAGFYWYARADDFIESAKSLIRKGASNDNKYFVCPVFNELVLMNMKIGVYEVASSSYRPVKTEKHLSASR